jgi:RNA recognition motif-containing protein
MEQRKLYVGNLNYRVTREQLSELFAQYGEVTYAQVIEQKGFGFIEFSTNEEAEKAKNELNGQEFDGRVLKIDYAKERQPVGGRGGGRPGDRGGRPGGFGRRF